MAARRLDPEHLGDHLDRLYRAAWALCGSREEAEDLVQETFARTLARPRLLRSGDDLGYLMKVMRNTFISGRRAASRRPRTGPLPENFEPPDVRLGARPDAAAEAHEVYSAIAALAPDFRDTLVAVDLVGLTYAEAGDLLGVKEATITSRLHRARAKVVAALRDDERQDQRREGVS